MTTNPLNCWVLLNKDVALGSTTAVTRVRRLFKAKKAGHAGTLDPLASGVLPIALGEATKLIPFIQDKVKVYRFKVMWGIETTTLDGEGEVCSTSPERPNAVAIKGVLPQFIGDISQKPPVFSAIKIDGQRAYDLARAGKNVQMPERRVLIHRLILLASTDQEAYFEVSCGKGTYVRSLARDIAYALGTVGHVTYLHRAQVGNFLEEKAISLEKLEEFVHKGAGDIVLQDLRMGLDDIPALILTERQKDRLQNGQRLKLPTHQIIEHDLEYLFVQCLSEAEQLQGIGRLDQRGVLHPHRLLNT